MNSAPNVAPRSPDQAEDRTLDPDERLFGIREICEEMDLSARTVRYWEELGLLPDVRRRVGGRRVYGLDEFERVRFIQRLKTLGLSLAEIKELNAVYAIAGSTADMLKYLGAQLGKHLGGLDARIDELVTLRDEMKRYQIHISERTESFPASTAEPSQEITK
jgi:DNA-binding transcriptional MerR regulator